MKFETKRLIIRKPRLSDWKDVVEGRSNLSVGKNMKWGSYPYTKKDATDWINWLLKVWRKKNKESYTFFLELKSNKKVIGETGIYFVNTKEKKATAGSWINKAYWRKGYLLEAKVPVFDFAFNILKLRKIESSTWKENKASNAMQKKLGFVYEGMKRKSACDQATGKFHDVNLYGLFKQEWRKVRPKILKGVKKKTQQNP